MPKIRPLGKTDYNKLFQGELQAARVRLLMDRKTVAQKIGCSYGTVKNYETEPHKIPIGWLKAFIKLTNIKPEAILEFLYEQKYEVKTLK